MKKCCKKHFHLNVFIGITFALVHLWSRFCFLFTHSCPQLLLSKSFSFFQSGSSVHLINKNVLMVGVWFLCNPPPAAVTVGLHMFDSHDLNVSQARVHFHGPCVCVSLEFLCADIWMGRVVGCYRQGLKKKKKNSPRNVCEQCALLRWSAEVIKGRS